MKDRGYITVETTGKQAQRYQLMCSYYSAVGEGDAAYLLARVVQFFAPGIPQVYYVGMLAGANDLPLVEETRQGRDINRHRYTAEEAAREVRRPVVQKLRSLMRFRNECEAFEGPLRQQATADYQLALTRAHNGTEVRLLAYCITYRFTVETRKAGEDWQPVAL